MKLIINLLLTLEQHIVNKMASVGMFFAIFIAVPITIAIIIGVIVGLVGCCVIKPGKLVRIIYPYIRRNGKNTVVFGFILGKWHVYGFFWGVIWIIYQVTVTFCTNILIIYANNNPYSATSVELECFYDNGSIAELTAIERLELNKNIICFAINYNIAGAMGQATSALAMGWIITSVLTWIILKLNYKITKRIKNTKKLECYKVFSIIIVVIIGLTNFIVRKAMPVIGLYYYTQWFLQPENATILVIFEAMTHILHTDITKEPKSFEEHCRKTMEAQVEKIKPNKIEIKRITRGIARLEYYKLVVQVMGKCFKEETMQDIAVIAFNEVIRQEHTHQSNQRRRHARAQSHKNAHCKRK